MKDESPLYLSHIDDRIRSIWWKSGIPINMLGISSHVSSQSRHGPVRALKYVLLPMSGMKYTDTSGFRAKNRKTENVQNLLRPSIQGFPICDVGFIVLAVWGRLWSAYGRQYSSDYPGNQWRRCIPFLFTQIRPHLNCIITRFSNWFGFVTKGEFSARNKCDLLKRVWNHFRVYDHIGDHEFFAIFVTWKSRKMLSGR